MLNRVPQRINSSVNELDFNQPVINIGSHPENDIRITGEDIFPFHAMILLQDKVRQLVSLTPEAEVRLDGILVDEPSVILSQNQRLEIGGYTLQFRGNGAPNGVHVSVIASDFTAISPASTFRMERGEKAILVNILSSEVDIEVEQTAFFELEVVNAGPIVASFFVTLQGVPEDWIDIPKDVFNLYEGEREVVSIRVTPPRKPSSTAGIHEVNVQVASPNYPGSDVITPFDLNIRPYYEFALGNISPKHQRIRWRKRTGRAQLPISNRGNSTTDFNVSAIDDENGCSFDFQVSEELQLNRQATITIPEGEAFSLPFSITPMKQALFALRGKRYHFTTTVQVSQQIALPQTISASATSLPLFGWWSIMFGILVLLAGLFLLLQPRIQSFELAAGKDVIELGDTTRLEWSVSPFATRLSISNVDQPIDRGQKSLTVAPSQSTTYELVSGNWLSGLLGMDRKASQTVLVIPPSPEIGVFDVDSTTVGKGSPITVRWSVTKADQVFLTIDEVVYELPPEQFSGEQEYILEKDAILTLEAINASGSELRSYFVNVVPPHIDVLAFTVWVRPEGSAGLPNKAAKAGGRPLAQEVYIPDQNFPEKFVSLVPDKASDSGYRAEFFQPDRELAKGEQVLLEWNIDGVESVLISPFVEELPNKGVQPFFPQESMNFVMTAVSGELERIFMLPVKVFDGIPPEAPTIDFFQGSPAKMVGGGPVEFAWSVSGEWTRVQLSGSEKVIADYLNPQGFKTVNVSQSGTFILTAWNGEDLSTAAPFDITVDPDLISITLSITSVYPTTGRFMVGDKVTVSVAFGETPADKPAPSGEIIVSDGFATCSIALPALSCDLTFVTPGDPKKITASYSGDDIYLQATSPPYAGSITVSSANVNLVPTYFYLDKETNLAGANIPNITEQILILDTGLYIKVKVAPVNTLIPDDDKGKVTLSICEQEGEDAIVEDSCSFYSAKTVVVNEDGSGQADIVIQNFLSTGTKVLVFDYRHDENAITPASLTQYGIVVEKRQIFLSLPICQDPVAFTGCEVGVSNPASTKVTFDIRNSSDGKLLSASLPAPQTERFEVFEENSSGGRIEDWVCTVLLAVEQDLNVYKLDCVADFTGQTLVYVNYDFDNAASDNYYMGDSPTGDFSRDPFELKIKTQTFVSLDPPVLTGLKVGERAILTPSEPDGAIKLTDAGGNPITNTIGDLELSSSATTAFGIVSGSSCSVIAGTVTIGSINSDCEIYFGEQGDFPLDVEFLGDDNYLQSSGSLDSVIISKQDEITTTWQYKNDSGVYVDWDITSWLSNKNLETRIWLGGPDEFVGQALSGKILNVSLNITKNTDNPPGTCNLTPNLGVEGTNPVIYKIAISVTGGKPKADFTLKCDQEPMDITLSIELADQDNFEIQAGQSVQRSLVFASRPTVSMEAHFTRVADDMEMISFNPDQLKTLYMGERYALEFVVGVLWADGFNPPLLPGGPTTIQQAINYYDNSPVNITFPDAVASLIDWNNTTCPQGTGGSDVQVLLDSYTVIDSYDYPPTETGIHDIEIYNQDPCILVFESGSGVLNPVDPARFEFYIDDPSYDWKSYDKTIVLQMLGLDKQLPSIENPLEFDNIIGIVGDDPDTDTLTLGRIVEGTSTLWPLNTSASFASQFSIGAPAGCPNILQGTVTNQTDASFTLTPPNTACQGTLAVEYLGNSWFKSRTIATYAVNYSNATSTDTTLVSSDSTSEYKQSVTFTASVSPANATGTVQFQDGTTNLGGAVPLVNGNASYTTADLTLGIHTIKATYTSDTNEFAGSQDTITQTIVAAPTVVNLTTSKSPSLLGESVTFTANVSAAGPGGGIPTGSVQFKDGATNIGSAVTLSNGTASKTTNTLTSGSHSITAVFTPATTNYISNTSPILTQQVNMETDTTLSSNSNDKKTVYGEYVTFTANVVVQSPGTGTATGSVQFKDGNTNLGSPVALSSGIATLSINTLIVGNHSLTAVYIPTGDFDPSTSSSLNHTVNAAATTTVLEANKLTVTTTETVVFTATVTVDLPGSGIPTGSVQFKDGNSNLGAPIALNGNGVAIYTGTLGTAGKHDITAMYISSSSNYQNSTSSKVTVTVV